MQVPCLPASLTSFHANHAMRLGRRLTPPVSPNGKPPPGLLRGKIVERPCISETSRSRPGSSQHLQVAALCCLQNGADRGRLCVSCLPSTMQSTRSRSKFALATWSILSPYRPQVSHFRIHGTATFKSASRAWWSIPAAPCAPCPLTGKRTKTDVCVVMRRPSDFHLRQRRPQRPHQHASCRGR